MNFERAGRGDPLVLVHGIGSELCVWEAVFESLAAQRDVIAVDLPGFGRSAALAEDVVPTPRELAGALAALIDELELGVPHLAGNSLGGWVALELAKMGRARTVTCLSPAGLWSRPLTRATAPTQNPARLFARGLGPLLPVLLRSRRLRHLALMSYVAHPERIPLRAAQRMVRSYSRASAYDATSFAMRSSFLMDVERVQVPITVGWGERDRLVAPVALRNPHAEAHVLPGCGHVPMWDDPPLVTRLLLHGSSRTGRGDEGAAGAPVRAVVDPR